MKQIVDRCGNTNGSNAVPCTANRRQFQRTSFITAGWAVPANAVGVEASSAGVRIWSVDVAKTGLLIKTTEEFLTSHLLLELLLPEFAGSLVLGRIVRRETQIVEHLNGRQKTFHLLGIEICQRLPRRALAKPFPRGSVRTNDTEHTAISRQSPPKVVQLLLHQVRDRLSLIRPETIVRTMLVTLFLLGAVLGVRSMWE
ncbi:hypothetical protein KOR42_34380 [Thalassoglobus neptunius]|uniref:PilZ domain-containing protein n=1 Tax=Thalassoglobus neptunius TaxID=1938619 RepID=A0A5C5WNP8_9PLAN|nr:hypothetical protein [Thalassoglobus neptunius]TWT51751.1 hypothetical protein KOR42_34380 [Thalassoglobus neptunius]